MPTIRETKVNVLGFTVPFLYLLPSLQSYQGLLILCFQVEGLFIFSPSLCV